MTQDWFWPAVATEGSVDSGLRAVIRTEEQRLHFAKCLHGALCGTRASHLDSISLLRNEVVALKKTLDHRLGILRPDLANAWFRESFPSQLGPFPSEVSLAPILPQLSPHLARKARNEILQLWQSRERASALFPLGHYLWSTLLALNERWGRINQLAEPFADLRLDELPEALPDILATTSLIAYLSRVNQAMVATRGELNRLFQQFFKSTEAFLLTYYQRPSHSQPPPQRSPRQGAIADSLRFMRFETRPTPRDLKRRYFELAKRFHPDAPGGSADRFQVLTSHYKKIMAEIEGW